MKTLKQICWDILYLPHEDAYQVLHCQEYAVTSQEAIDQARKELGDDTYFVSVKKHRKGMNKGE